MSKLPWFRLYHRMIDDEKIRVLAFEDRWHFVAICCLKADGILDEPESAIKWRKISVKLGVQSRELEEIKRRLLEAGLVDDDMHPKAWDDLQFKSDTSTQRVRRFREKANKNNDETQRNVSVTVQETDTDTDTYKKQKQNHTDGSFERFWSAYPKRDGGNPKKPAEQKFKIALRKTDAETIIAAATRYAADQRNRHGASPSPYTKQAATWLSQECWTEYQPTPLDNREGLVEDDPWRLRHQLWSKTRAWHVDWGNIHDLPEEWRQRFADALEWDRHPRRGT